MSTLVHLIYQKQGLREIRNSSHFYRSVSEIFAIYMRTLVLITMLGPLCRPDFFSSMSIQLTYGRFRRTPYLISDDRLFSFYILSSSYFEYCSVITLPVSTESKCKLPQAVIEFTNTVSPNSGTNALILLIYCPDTDSMNVEWYSGRKVVL